MVWLAAAIAFASLIGWDVARRIVAQRSADREKQIADSIKENRKELQAEIDKLRQEYEEQVCDFQAALRKLGKDITDTIELHSELAKLTQQLGTDADRKVTMVTENLQGVISKVENSLREYIHDGDSHLRERNDSQIKNILKEVHGLLQSFETKQAGMLGSMGGVRGRNGSHPGFGVKLKRSMAR